MSIRDSKKKILKNISFGIYFTPHKSCGTLSLNIDEPQNIRPETSRYSTQGRNRIKQLRRSVCSRFAFSETVDPSFCRQQRRLTRALFRLARPRYSRLRVTVTWHRGRAVAEKTERSILTI